MSGYIIPAVPLPDTFEPTHVCNGAKVQAIVIVGGLALIRKDITAHYPYLWPIDSLTPIHGESADD